MEQTCSAENMCLYEKHKTTLEEIFYDMDNSLWRLGDILKDFKYKEDTQDSYAFSAAENTFFIHLYKLIAHTRDISRDGRGDRNNTYTQIAIWNYYFPEMAKDALKQIVNVYGCWRDIRQFCNYYMNLKGLKMTRTRDGKIRDLPDIVNYCIDLMITQLKNDGSNLLQKKTISNASKWCPREKNKEFGWLFFHLACRYFHTTHISSLVSKNFRIILTLLNKYNNTPQINFCNDTWSEINVDTISYKTYIKNKSAIHNLNNSGGLRYPNSKERIMCSENFFLYGNQYNSPCKPLSNKYLSGLFRNDLVNKVVDLYSLNLRNNFKFATIDHIWENKYGDPLPSVFTDMIPIIETSSIMKNTTQESKTAFINAVTIAGSILKHQNKIRGQEENKKNIDTLLCNYANYDEAAQFKSIDSISNDYSITSLLTQLINGLRPNYNTSSGALSEKANDFDFSKFYDLFLMKLVYERHHPDVANRKTLLFLCGDVNKKRVEKKLKKKYDRCVLNYHRTGIKLTGFPFVPPKIIIWNMASSVSEIPAHTSFTIGNKKTACDIKMINSKSDSRYNGFMNFTENFLENGNVNESFTRMDNIVLNVSKPRYEDFNPFYV